MSCLITCKFFIPILANCIFLSSVWFNCLLHIHTPPPPPPLSFSFLFLIKFCSSIYVGIISCCIDLLPKCVHCINRFWSSVNLDMHHDAVPLYGQVSDFTLFGFVLSYCQVRKLYKGILAIHDSLSTTCSSFHLLSFYFFVHCYSVLFSLFNIGLMSSGLS